MTEVQLVVSMHVIGGRGPYLPTDPELTHMPTLRPVPPALPHPLKRDRGQG